MEPNRDWTDALRRALRDAEATPPPAGWERLERELGSAAPSPTPLRRLPRMRVAAAAATVLLAIGAGELFWHAAPDADDLPVVTLIETLAEDTIREEGTSAGRAVADAAASAADRNSSTAAAAGRASGVSVSDRRAASAVVPAVASANSAPANRPAATAVSPNRPSTPRPLTASAATATSASGTATAAARAAGSVSVPADPKSATTTSAITTTTTNTTVTTATTAAAPSSATASRRAVRPEERLAAYAAPRRKASLSLFAAGGLTGSERGPGLVSRSLAELSGADEVYVEGLRYEDYCQSSFRHHQPLSFGLTVRKELGRGFSVETGVVYTLLWADVRMPLGTEDFSQKLHFIGVPVRVNWNFVRGRRFLLYIGAGAMVETCAAARFGSTSVEEPGAFWSVSGAVGGEYRLGGLVGLYFEPDVSYYFNQTRLRTTRTDAAATFTLRLGVRLNF